MSSTLLSRATRARRRTVSGLLATALAAATLAVTPGTAQAAPTPIDDATFTWGISGYAQKGIFGPWTITPTSPNATVLPGATQTEYVTPVFPATSFPANATNPNPNAIKLTGGTGTLDRTTGAGSLAWDASYSVNAYPAQYNAPTEVYEDPQLTVAADGSGTLTMDVSFAAGQDMGGNPTPAQDFGRIPVATFSAGDVAATSTGFRLTPDYQGVTVEGLNQDRTCTGTDVWGAWPAEFMATVGNSSVGPHFYSSSCGGMQNAKPALPIDLTVAAEPVPTVTIDDTELRSGEDSTITVTGTGFDPALATGTRPPFAGRQSGLYIAFGRFAEAWRPSQGAASSTRTTAPAPGGTGVSTIWAVPQATLDATGQSGAAYTVLDEDGSFTATLKVNDAWFKDVAANPDGTLGVYTYPGSGATAAAYETATPLAFKSDATVTAAPVTSTYGKAASIAVEVVGGDTVATGTVTVDGVGSATLSNGKAVVKAPADLKVGTHTFEVAYAGDASHFAATASTKVTVAKAATAAPRIALSSAATTVRAGRVTIDLTAGGAQPTGRVAVTLTKGTERRALVGTLVRGRATVAVPALSAGTWRATVSYAGSGTQTAATGTTTFVVRKASIAKPAVKVVKKPTTRKAGSVRVTVRSASAGTPSGKVRVQLVKGRSTRTYTVRLDSRGQVDVKTAKLAKGSWKVYVTYYGDAKFDARAKVRTSTVKVTR